MPDNDQPQGLNLGLSDIYHVLFKHKWKILLLAFAGIAAAGFVYFRHQVYRSTAKLLVRYVDERRSVTPVMEGERGRAPESPAGGIMQTEIEILTSWDLAVKVAEAVGPERILARVGGGTNINQAAGLVRSGIRTEIPNSSKIIAVSFEHPDPDVVVPILTRLIEDYLTKHVEIHRAVASYEFLSKQTDVLRAKLAETEEQLRKLKSQAGVISVQDSRQELAAKIGTISQAILNTQADLAERKAAAVLAGRDVPPAPKSNEVVTLAPKSADEVARYRAVFERLNALRAREGELLLRLTESNSLVTAVRGQISETEKQKKDMEAANPALTAIELAVPATGGRPTDVLNEMASPAILEAKLKVLNEQFEKVKQEAAAFEAVENTIVKLQRERDLEENNLRYFTASLEQARIDGALDASKLSSINLAQAPSPPAPDFPKEAKKLAAVALAGGVLGGIVLAFLLELFIDQSVKRPVEIEGRLGLPLILSIPRQSRRAAGIRPRIRKSKKAAPRQEANPTETSSKSRPTEIAPWDPRHALRPFCEALRDRILIHFESVNRRPKLVGVTGCATGAGVTTLAAGLAAAMSETGQGKVLLVDMNGSNGAAHPFLRGKPACGLTEALEDGKTQTALLQDNLVLASNLQTTAGAHPVVTRTLLEVMPKLKASDYDYVIFDLPPVSQTSITFRLAGYMDEVLLVIEADKTHKDLAQKACTLLTQSKANLATILNKYRTYVPKSLQQEL